MGFVLPGLCRLVINGEDSNGPTAVIHEQLLWGRPTGSHDHRFQAENTRGRSNLFHLTMTWKRLGLNSYKTDLC